jgi:hypothetical protein
VIGDAKSFPSPFSAFPRCEQEVKLSNFNIHKPIAQGCEGAVFECSKKEKTSALDRYYALKVDYNYGETHQQILAKYNKPHSFKS